MQLRPIEWIPDQPGALFPGRVRFIDQLALPQRLTFVETRDAGVLATAIRSLQIRGAPAIGIAGAMGVALAAQQAVLAGEPAAPLEHVRAQALTAANTLERTRPTAVNLRWAIDRARCILAEPPPTAVALTEKLIAEAVAIRDEDARMCRAIGEHGLTLLRDGMNILTHCNAGALATAELGTALAPVYIARERGQRLHVFVDETRPHFQGARLTVWELQAQGVPVTLICDNTAGVLMREKRVDAVLVGADRIAANGDTANKIGTYSLAVLARKHGLPFYVLAPTSTFDLTTPTGDGIPIEHRPPEDLIRINGKAIAPENTDVFAPIFDVTPAELITAIVCEKGILRPPFEKNIRRLFA